MKLKVDAVSPPTERSGEMETDGDQTPTDHRNGAAAAAVTPRWPNTRAASYGFGREAKRLDTILFWDLILQILYFSKRRIRIGRGMRNKQTTLMNKILISLELSINQVGRG